MNGKHIYDSLYGCRSYAEFKLKLGLFGFKNIPSEDVFNMCHPDDWKWETLCMILKHRVEKDMSVREIDALVEKSFGVRHGESRKQTRTILK